MMNEHLIIEGYLAKYRKAALGTGNPDPKLANKHAIALMNYHTLLRDDREGQRGITELILDASPHVRCWAATHSLEWEPDRAQKALEELMANKGPCSFDAKIVLQEYRKGALIIDDRKIMPNPRNDQSEAATN